MNTFKKFARKPIAVIIGLLIAVGAISAVVYAEPELTGSFTTNTLWSIYDSGTSSYVSAGSDGTVYAAPGTLVKADVYATSTMTCGNISLVFYFDDSALQLDTGKHSVYRSSGSLYYYNLISAAGLSGEFVDAKRTSFPSMVEDGVFPEGTFDGLGGLFVNATGYTYRQYSNDNILTFFFKVKEAVAIDGQGELKVYPGSTASSSLGDDAFYVNGNVAYYDQNTGSEITSEFYNLTSESASQTISVAGQVGFNTVSPYGSAIIESSPVYSGNLTGFYNTALTASVLPEVTAAEGYKFIGWSAEQASGPQVVSGKNYYGGDYGEIITDYSAIKFESPGSSPTLYAVYGDADVKYTVKLYTPDLDAAGKELSGTYTLAATYADLDGSVNDVISAEDSAVVNPAWIPDGFENNSIASVTLGLNAANNVLEVRLDRTTKRIKWIIGSETVKGGDEAPVTVYYGGNADTANYPDPTAAELGDDYFGKGITWSNHETSPVTGDIEVTGTLSNLPVTVYINAQDTINNVTGTWYGEDGVVNHEVTGLKYNDSIPADAASTLQLPEGYESVAFRYNDADGVSQRVNSLSQIPAINKENVEIGSDLVFSIDVEYILHTGYAVFNANGGSFEDDEVTDNVPYNYGDIILERSAPENPKKVNGYTYDFLGWATTANATVPDAVFDSEGPVFGSEDPVFYAVWKYDTVKLMPKNTSSTVMIERDNNAETYNTDITISYKPYGVNNVIQAFDTSYGTYSRYSEDATQYDSWYVYGLGKGTTVTKLADYITVSGNGSYTVEGAYMGRVVGTGTVIKVFDKNGDFVEQFRVVIYGDIDGNGAINGTDTAQALNEVSLRTWSGRTTRVNYIFRAADLDQNGAYNGTDSAIHGSVVSGESSINQKTGRAN